MTEQTNAVVVSKGYELGNTLVPDLFKDIDFNGLNGAIENMAAASGEITKEDKELARGIIDEWNYSVIERLRDKEQDMHSFMHFFTDNTSLRMGHMNLDEFGPELAEKTDTKKEYGKVLETQEKLKLFMETKPEREVTGASATFEERVTKDKDYEAKLAIWYANEAKVEKAVNVAIGDWKRKMNETQEVKELLVAARKMLRGASKMRQHANDKSQMAKLNISIASKTARDSLKELLAFTSTI